MALFIVCLLSVIATALGQSVGGSCGALGSNGATVESGFVYYLCQDGKLIPKGCVTLDKKHIDIGQTGDYRQSKLSCEMGGKVLPSLVLKACVFNGAERAVGAEFTDGKSVYTCTKKDNDGEVKPVGCADDGKTAKFGDKIVKADGVYECLENGALRKAGCVRDGKQFNIGDTFEVANTWYNCTRSGPKASGCISGGKKLSDGDRFFENDVIFECFIENDKVDLRVAGCVQHDGGSTVERRLNCYWVEGPEPLQYEWTCRHAAGANTAEKVQIRCNYKLSKGVYSIEPGCYRVIEKAAFGCVKSGSGLNLQSFQGDDAAKAAAAAGLQAC